MTEQLLTALRPVRRRQRWQALLQALVQGLLAGSLVALAWGVLRGTGMTATTAGVAGAVTLGALAGMAWGLSRERGWHAAAVAVDTHYTLKDRTVSALSFAQIQEQQASTIHRLQIIDAIDYLNQVEPRRVVPITVPKILPAALASAVMAVGLMFVPRWTGNANADSVVTLPHVQDEAEQLRNTLIEQLLELTEEHPNSNLKQLVSELERHLVELAEPGVDQRQALTKLSEMQAAIAKAQAEYDLDATDDQLKALGEALSLAKSTQPAGEALQGELYDEAAQELEDLEPVELSPEESEALIDELNKLAAAMKQADQQQLGEATDELSQGLEDEDMSRTASGATQLAQLARMQAIRKAIAQRLDSQLARLAEAKANCRTSVDGGDGTSKSKNPSENWGLGVTGQPLGEQTDPLNSRREQVNITGTLGEGPIEKELVRTTEAQEEAQRAYRQQYQQYEKMNEAILDSEALPLGHRQTIRRYFESIRPERDTDQSTAGPGESALETK